MGCYQTLGTYCDNLGEYFILNVDRVFFFKFSISFTIIPSEIYIYIEGLSE